MPVSLAIVSLRLPDIRCIYLDSLDKRPICIIIQVPLSSRILRTSVFVFGSHILYTLQNSRSIRAYRRRQYRVAMKTFLSEERIEKYREGYREDSGVKIPDERLLCQLST